MSYPLYKETNYPRSCSLTPEQLEQLIDLTYIELEVHDADSHQLLRFVSHEEIIDKWYAGKITPFVKDRDGKFVPKLKGKGQVVFYRLSW